MMFRWLVDWVCLIVVYMCGQIGDISGLGVLMIEIMVCCNLFCLMCLCMGVGYLNVDMFDELFWFLFEEYVCLGGDYVYLYGFGELLMDS